MIKDGFIAISAALALTALSSPVCRAGQETIESSASLLNASSAAYEKMAGTYLGEGTDFSRLVLEKDGRFEWLLVGGSTDNYLKGVWEVQGAQMHLSIEEQEEEPFTLAEVDQWNEESASELRASEERRMYRYVHEACPFLETFNRGMFYMALSGEDTRKNSSDKRGTQEIDSALAASMGSLHRAKELADQAINEALDAKTQVENYPTDKGKVSAFGVEMARAKRATAQYFEQLESARRAYVEVGRDMPNQPTPEFEYRKCSSYMAAVDVRDGFAVKVVSEGAAGSLMTSGVGVFFSFSDGEMEFRLTGEGGWAAVQKLPGVQLDRLLLLGGDSRLISIPTGTSTGDVFTVRMSGNARKTAEFTEMYFSIDDGDLISAEHQWRYQRL